MTVVKIIMSSFEVTETKARKIMERLDETALAGLVSDHYSGKTVPREPRIPTKKVEPELVLEPLMPKTENKSITGKVLNHFYKQPGIDIKVSSLIKRIKAPDTAVRSACERLVRKKELKKTGRGTYRYQ